MKTAASSTQITRAESATWEAYDEGPGAPRDRRRAGDRAGDRRRASADLRGRLVAVRAALGGEPELGCRGVRDVERQSHDERLQRRRADLSGHRPHADSSNGADGGCDVANARVAVD